MQYIPVFDHLAVSFDPKYIHTRPVFVPVSRPLLVAMEDDVLTFRYRVFEVDALAGILPGHALEIFNEGLLAVFHVGVVLDICFSRIPFNRLHWFALIQNMNSSSAFKCSASLRQSALGRKLTCRSSIEHLFRRQSLE